MAHILIATSNMYYRRDLADVLRAADHDVVTTSDTGLALAALRMSNHSLIALLGDVIRLNEIEGRSLLKSIANETSQPTDRYEHDGYTRHAYILLTQLPYEKLPAGARLLLATKQAVILQPNCSIGALLTTIEVTAERLSENEEGIQRQEERGTAMCGCAASGLRFV